MKVKDLKGADYNPRKISNEKLAMLEKAMQEFGDLSGIVCNVQTGNLIGGHQRLKKLDPSWDIVTTDCKDKVGTIAMGHIETPFGQWAYREVDWSETKEKAANIAANKQGGEWDIAKLSDLAIELDAGEFDMELVGLDTDELEALLIGKTSFIDELLNNAVGEEGHGENFQLTLILPVKVKESVIGYIKINTKEPLTEMVIAECLKSDHK